MAIRTNTDLSSQLKAAQRVIRERAIDYGLDFFETIFEVLDYDTMNQLASYGGFPVRYPHWRWGMEYEKLSKRDTYGMGRIYEMVINNDPCYAYLQESNSFMGQKLVMAHVYAHCDFFKCNAWFAKTPRNMMDEMANHATRIQKYIDKHGKEEVEHFLDACLSIEHLIDPHSMFQQRETTIAAGSALDPLPADVEKFAPTKLPAKEYLDRYINPSEEIERQRIAYQAKVDKDSKQFPAEPTRDILLFLIRYAPLKEWQRHILSMIRQEAYYFAPQAMTKIMNEGWATYWHTKIMTTHILEAPEIIDYADQHSGVVYMPPGGFNPYKIGVEMFKDIERRWDKGQHGRKWEELDGIGDRKRYDDESKCGREKIFEVRKIYNDINFIEEFMTPDFIEEHKLYHYQKDPRTGQTVIASKDPEVVRQVLLYRISNMGQPYMYVADANFGNHGDLYLANQWNGMEVDASSASETMRAIQLMWQRPVHVQMRVNKAMTLITFDGKEFKNEPITKNTPQPAHIIT